MATKNQEMQRLIRLYKQETGETEVDMHQVALFAARVGWPLPRPTDPLDLLASQFSQAASKPVRGLSNGACGSATMDRDN